MASLLNEIHNLSDLDQALADSTNRPVLLFKHSLTCPISARAFRELEVFLESAGPGASYNLITVQIARPLSDEVAARLGIEHESPQAILVRDGSGIWNASHFEITEAALKDALSQVQR